MGGGSDSKKQLGKIMLQQRVVSAEDLQEEAARQAAEASRESTAELIARQRAPVLEALAALSAEHNVPSVDLSERVVQLAILRLVPAEMARERLVMPFAIEGEGLSIALAAPGDSELLEELAFIVGKPVTPHVCLPEMLRNVIEHAYAQLARGEEQLYVGTYVTSSQLAALGLPNVPRAPDPMRPVSEPEAVSAGKAPSGVSYALRGSGMPSEPPKLDDAFGQRTRPSEMPPMMAPASEARVLLASGDATLREPLHAELVKLGMTVIEADSGVRALEIAREHDLKVLVIDADLEQVHGFDVWRRLRSTSRFAQAAAIVITGGPRQWRLREDLREVLGVLHCHARPIDPKKLARSVRILLDNPQAPPELPPLSAEAEALWNSAMQAFQNGSLDQAISMLETGLALEPDAFELRYHLGLLYGRRDNAFAAIHALEQAVALQPHHFSALKNLAVVYQRAGFRHASIDVWQQAMSAAPDDETRATIREHMLSLL